MNGNQLRQLRLYYNLTIQQFADRVGTSRTTICAIERGERHMSQRVRAKIVQNFPEIDDSFLSFSEKMRKIIHFKDCSTKNN